jgi:protein-S-isoprenylcysteine O-methyltransferase Ste14
MRMGSRGPGGLRAGTMSASERPAESTPSDRQGRLSSVWYALWGLALVVGWVAGPYLAAGSVRWPAGWAYDAVLVSGLLLHRRFVVRHNPSLLRRRRRIGEGTPRWDVVWNLAFWPLMIAIPVVAGLGARYAWDAMPAAMSAMGVALLAAGLGLSAWAMAVNPHFEATVRIQDDVGHRVIDAGPYRALRHPGYAGLALWGLATPFLLLSWAALAPAFAVLLWVVLRTALEDRFLRRHLAGYAEYASRVRARLIPRCW